MSILGQVGTSHRGELQQTGNRSIRVALHVTEPEGVAVTTCDAADGGSILWAWGFAGFLKELDRKTSAPMVWAVFENGISSCYVSNSLHGLLGGKGRPRYNGVEEQKHLCVAIPCRSFYRGVDDVPHRIDAENRSWRAIELLGTMASYAVGELGTSSESTKNLPHVNLVSKVLTRAAIPLLVAACDELGDCAEARRIVGAKGRHLRLLLQIVRERFRDPSFSLRRLSALSGLSNRYVNAIFQESGASFSERVLDARLRWAYQELSYSPHTGRKIGKIAYDAGFTDQPYFNRAFKRRFGMSPREILRRFDLTGGTEGDEIPMSVQSARPEGSNRILPSQRPVGVGSPDAFEL